MKKILVILLFVPLLPVAASAQPTECDGNFHIVHRFANGYLQDIDFSNQNDGWTVGYDVPDDGQNEHPLIVRFDENSFEHTALPVAAGGGGALLAVDALSPNDAFAVGYTYPNFDSTETFITRWDGNEWLQMTAPSPGEFAQLDDVVAITPTDVWAVGGFARGRRGFDPLVLHFDGTSWTRVEVPTRDASVDGLSTVDALGPGDVWAGGFQRSQAPLLMHFDGEAWTRQRVGTLTEDNSLFYGIDAVAPDDVWAVGIGLAAHMTADGWAATVLPDTRGKEWLDGVAAEPGGEAWAVGFRYRIRVEDIFTLALYWDGTAWHRVTFEGGRRGQVTAVALDGAGAAWAVGLNVNAETSQFEQVIERACT